MELYDLLNIGNKDYEKSTKESILEITNDLNGLIDERTCKIYSSYLYKYLHNMHILSRIIDAKGDLNLDYQHWFVKVPVNENSNYIIDLTYSQFGIDDNFNKMYKEYLSNIKLSTKRK